MGQFGVGFYSAYLVADQVKVDAHTQLVTTDSVRWASEAKDGFTVEPAERETRAPTIILHLKKARSLPMPIESRTSFVVTQTMLVTK